MPHFATVRLTLPPNVANQRKHWAVKLKEKKAWMARATVELANSGLRPKKPLERYTVHVTVVTMRRSDLDNCTARLKMVFDTMKKLGWVADDGPKHMESLTVVNQVSQQPRVEVYLREV